MNDFASCVTNARKSLPTIQCHVGPYFPSKNCWNQVGLGQPKEHQYRLSYFDLPGDIFLLLMRFYCDGCYCLSIILWKERSKGAEIKIVRAFLSHWYLHFSVFVHWCKNTSVTKHLSEFYGSTYCRTPFCSVQYWWCPWWSIALRVFMDVGWFFLRTDSWHNVYVPENLQIAHWLGMDSSTSLLRISTNICLMISSSHVS